MNQWEIEECDQVDYTIKYEVLVVGIIWFLCNNLINFIWIIDYNIYDLGK